MNEQDTSVPQHFDASAVPSLQALLNRLPPVPGHKGLSFFFGLTLFGSWKATWDVRSGPDLETKRLASVFPLRLLLRADQQTDQSGCFWYRMDIPKEIDATNGLFTECEDGVIPFSNHDFYMRRGSGSTARLFGAAAILALHDGVFTVKKCRVDIPEGDGAGLSEALSNLAPISPQGLLEAVTKHPIINETVVALRRRARQHYSSENDTSTKPEYRVWNYYHTWDHAKRVANEAAWTALNKEGIPYMAAELYLAGLWHDAIYVPNVPNGMNEAMSAQAFLNAVKAVERELPINFDREFTASLIRQTAVSVHRRSHGLLFRTDGFTSCHVDSDWDSARKALSVLLDADLSSMADPYDDFVATQSLIAGEVLGLSEKEMADGWLERTHHLHQSADWLNEFISDKEGVYRTSYYRATKEEAAVANIRLLTKENPAPKE